MIKTNYYPSPVSISAGSEVLANNGQEEGLDFLEAVIEAEEFEHILGPTDSSWPEWVNCKRSRHSYAYYQSDF